MKGLLALALALGFVTALPAVAQTHAAQSRQLAFGPGEQLEFHVAYGPLPAGRMELRVVELGKFDGRPAYRFASEVASNRAISVVYELESREEAWFDADKLQSLKYTRTSVENDKPRNREYIFDQQRNLRIEPDGDTKPASPRAVDQLSMIYYLRLLPYEPGSKFVLRNQADPDDNPLTVEVLKKERLKVPAGTFETYVLKLGLKTDSGVFKKGGDNRLWVTTDARHLPVKLSSRIGLGSFQGELVRYVPGETVFTR